MFLLNFLFLCVIIIIKVQKMMIATKAYQNLAKKLSLGCYNYFASRKPIIKSPLDVKGDQIKVIHTSQADEYIPSHKAKQFKDKKMTSYTQIIGDDAEIKENSIKFYSQNSWKKLKDISKSTTLMFSPKIQTVNNFEGLASQIITKSYKFSRKQADQKNIEIGIDQIVNKEYILELANAKIQAAQWAGSRGNQMNTYQILQQAQRIATIYPSVGIKIIKGNQLLNEGFNLLHAVGRASKNQPMMICLQWRGGEIDEPFVSFVGKGLTFDSGGLNLKPTSGISGMHNDKHGACSVLSAFESAVKLKLKSNLVAVIGLAENFVSSNSFRPLDIIKSRKGLTVEIGNTDAQGRLVLADCMNWVQQKYKLSTLTGAVIIALGKERAGLFSNSHALCTELQQRGDEMDELLWRLPVDFYHTQLVKSKTADITNSSGKSEGSSSQAAAFLKNFVQPKVQWAHIDIAGVAGQGSNSTGYGAKLLLHYIKAKSPSA